MAQESRSSLAMSSVFFSGEHSQDPYYILCYLIESGVT